MWEDSTAYVQQRDEYLEQVCEMALRKISIVTVCGTATNSTMKVDHYQLEHDKPMKAMRKEDLLNRSLIAHVRNEFGMVPGDFHMVLTDFDMKVKQSYEVPIALKAVLDYVDTLPPASESWSNRRRAGWCARRRTDPDRWRTSSPGSVGDEGCS
ncbi:hypothetical protein AAFF_G00259400 [Aldrovandia affinis]|uniref:Coiled-coil domain-containing protein 80 n=1 Tax=Aldrovandia affinis TaxID=143900 RepID=A0AAD7W306_9TELE|nr:hypothetical protein AAFF_G00259400 [Aldrovandia affinis]